MAHLGPAQWNQSEESITRTFGRALANRESGTNEIGSEVAIRLYRSVAIPYKNVKGNAIEYDINIQDSFNSPSCRICRNGGKSQALIRCPCNCRGTMGHIHMKCLNRWIRMKGSDFCEICHIKYNSPLLNRNFLKLLKQFFRPKYFGIIFADVFNIISLTPLIYVTIQQLLGIADASSDQTSIKLMIFGPSVLFASSIYFFLYFDWMLSRLFRIRHVLQHWWRFGDQDDDEYDEYLFYFLDDFFWELAN